MKKRRKRRRNQNKLGIISITIVVLMLSSVLTVKTINLREKNQELIEKKEQLEQTLEDQTQRKQQLEDQRAYVQTNDYIEEKAYDLGYIYPNEVIYKPIEE